MSLICFKPNFHVEILDSEQIVLFSEDHHHLLQGSVYVAIAKMIRCTPFSEQDIIDNLTAKFPIEGIRRAISGVLPKGFTRILVEVKAAVKVPNAVTSTFICKSIFKRKINMFYGHQLLNRGSDPRFFSQT